MCGSSFPQRGGSTPLPSILLVLAWMATILPTSVEAARPKDLSEDLQPETEQSKSAAQLSRRSHHSALLEEHTADGTSCQTAINGVKRQDAINKEYFSKIKASAIDFKNGDPATPFFRELWLDMAAMDQFLKEAKSLKSMGAGLSKWIDAIEGVQTALTEMYAVLAQLENKKLATEDEIESYNNGDTPDVNLITDTDGEKYIVTLDWEGFAPKYMAMLRDYLFLEFQASSSDDDPLALDGQLEIKKKGKLVEALDTLGFHTTRAFARAIDKAGKKHSKHAYKKVFTHYWGTEEGRADNKDVLGDHSWEIAFTSVEWFYGIAQWITHPERGSIWTSLSKLGVCIPNEEGGQWMEFHQGLRTLQEYLVNAWPLDGQPDENGMEWASSVKLLRDDLRSPCGFLLFVLQAVETAEMNDEPVPDEFTYLGKEHVEWP